MSSKEYNPLQHSVVQAVAGAWSRYECDDFVEALLDYILDEIKRVHWNVYQHQWGPTWHADDVEDPMIDGISFVRFYQDRCDCGGMQPNCKPDCRSIIEHRDWNDARLKWAEVPRSEEEIAEEQQRADEMWGEGTLWSAIATAGREIDMSKLASGDYQVPHPPCTCGAAHDWEEHPCTPECIGQRPNFQHEDVEFRWYKRPGRGMSTNKDWTSDEWRAWFQRCLTTVRSFEGEHFSEENQQRHERLQQEIRAKYPQAFRDGRNDEEDEEKDSL